MKRSGYNKVVRVGSIPSYDGGRWNPSLFCVVNIEGDRFSVSGVIGPKSNGDAVGGCGQIEMEFAHRDSLEDAARTAHLIQPEAIRYAPGWNAALWLDFLHIWSRWHLNDMHAGCEHQRVLPEFNLKTIEITYATLNYDAERQLVKDAERDIAYQYGENVVFYRDMRTACPVWPATQTAPARPAGVSLKTGSKFSPAIVILKVLHDFGIDKAFHKTAVDLDALKAALRRAKRKIGDTDVIALLKIDTESKFAGHVRPSEHPQGYLTKPCPVCGYQYGTAWIKESVPQEVIDWVHALPDADQQPAWI